MNYKIEDDGTVTLDATRYGKNDIYAMYNELKEMWFNDDKLIRFPFPITGMGRILAIEPKFIVHMNGMILEGGKQYTVDASIIGYKVEEDEQVS